MKKKVRQTCKVRQQLLLMGTWSALSSLNANFVENSGSSGCLVFVRSAM